FEFIPVESNGERTLDIWNLSSGSIYEIVVTNSVLYRYKTADLIEVVDFIAPNRVPIFKLIGRKNVSFALFNEKIPDFVLRNGVVNAAGFVGRTLVGYCFGMAWDVAARLVTYVEFALTPTPEAISLFRNSLETYLQENNILYKLCAERKSIGVI